MKKKGTPPTVRPPQEPGTNARLIANALSSWTLPKVDTKDPQAAEERVSDYLKHCLSNDVPPSVAGCANWLGVTVTCLRDWYTGRRETPEHQRIMTMFYGAMQEIWAQDMHEGNINPISGIFMGKVFYGYKDTQEIVVKQNSQNEISSDDLIAESKLLPGAEVLALPSGTQTLEDAPKIADTLVKAAEEKSEDADAKRRAKRNLIDARARERRQKEINKLAKEFEDAEEI